MNTEIQTTEITIIDKIKEIENTSGAVFEINLLQVTALANQAALITDPKTEDDFVQVTEIRKDLAKYRKIVSDFFMAARKGFNEKAKAIIQIEKDTLETFTLEEDRMKAFEKVRKSKVVRQERLEALPMKVERLDAIGDEIPYDTDEILAMEDAEFEIYINQRQTDKNEADRIEIEEAKAKVEDDIRKANEALEAKRLEADRIETARQEERDLANDKLRIDRERLETEKAESEARRISEAKEVEEQRLDAIKKEESEKQRIIQEEKDKAEAEAKVKIAAIAEKEADEKYQTWLKEIDYNESSFKLITLSDGSVEAYELVGTYKK